MPVGGGVKLEIILSLLKTFTMLDSSNPSPMCIVYSVFYPHPHEFSKDI